MADIRLTISRSRSDGKPRRHLSETLVMAAMCVVTVAFGAALYMQVGLTLWLTFIAALSLYVTLLTLHALVRRSDIVESLNSEIRRLEVEIARLTGQNPAHSAVQNRNSHVASRAPVPPPLTPAKPAPAVAASAPPSPSGTEKRPRKHGTPNSTRRRHTHARPARCSRLLRRQLYPQPRRHQCVRKRLRPRPPRRLHSQGQPVLRRRFRHTSPGPSGPPIPTLPPPLMAICRRRSH